MSRHIRILFVDDDPDYCSLVRSMLHETPDLQLVGWAATREEALALVQALEPDIVLMDLRLSAQDLEGIDVSRQIRLHSNAKVIILTGCEDREICIHACKLSYSSGYVYKSQWPLLIPTIREVAAGPTPMEYLIRSLKLAELSTAELTVFHSMLGKPVELISAEKTIANQKTSIFRKLGVKNAKELVHIFCDCANRD